ncbi:Selenide, water dikinase 2, partial [Saguinus oedipus]
MAEPSATGACGEAMLFGSGGLDCGPELLQLSALRAPGVPQETLLKLLAGLTRPDVRPPLGRGLVGGQEEASQETGAGPSPTFPALGIGMDSCVIPLRHGGLSL